MQCFTALPWKQWACSVDHMTEFGNELNSAMLPLIMPLLLALAGAIRGQQMMVAVSLSSLGRA
jgi:hypothetical protein